MKVPMKWLREYVDTDLSAQAYAERMVMTGTGVEEITNTGDGFDNVVVGHVLTCVPHPDSDHLHVTTVDVGGEKPLNIVCGAPNVAEGEYVAVALEGARLPGGIKIKKGKLRGVVSEGMLCSGPELGVPEGLYPHCGDEGILLFLKPYRPGTDVKEIFGLGDDVVDFEILANRPDCLSVWGIARESAAVLDKHLILPEIAVEETGSGTIDDYATIRVLDDTLCPRYCARVITDVKIGRSPDWMRAYLNAAGVRPINNIVDITNFVMLETGHPMHAFDLSKVRDQTIVVRRAHPGEILTTLDGKEHALSEDMLVIADAQNATGLAGIMGGEESEIVEGTTTVLFESATFDRTSIRLTTRALGMRTEASSRFEKGVCVNSTLEALERACMLVNMLECGRVVPGAFDHYPNPAAQREIDASVSRIAHRISADIPGEEMQDILERLGIETNVCGDEMHCVLPDWRGDIDGEADLSEEVLRLYGYEHIPSTLMTGVTMAGMRSDAQRLSDQVKRMLVDMGFYEAMTFSFISPKWLGQLGLSANDARYNPIVLRNPLGEDTSVMRTTLVPSMLSTLSTNINRGNASGKLFELAPVFMKRGAHELPDEHRMLCLGMYGENVDFYALKDAVCCLAAVFGLKLRALSGGDGYYHPGRKALLMDGDTRICQMGEIHPDVAVTFGIEKTRVYVAELDMNALMATRREIPPVKALPRFPAVSRDLALVVDESVGVGPLMETIQNAAGKTLEDIKLFDIYRGIQLGIGRKSVAFALTFRAADRTMTEADITVAMNKVLSACEKEHGAQIRK